QRLVEVGTWSLFRINHSDADAEVEADGTGLVTGTTAAGAVTVPAGGVAVIQQAGCSAAAPAPRATPPRRAPRAARNAPAEARYAMRSNPLGRFEPPWKRIPTGKVDSNPSWAHRGAHRPRQSAGRHSAPHEGTQRAHRHRDRGEAPCRVQI